jgi:glycosyltransferase involved in cell wall biosynthesis
MARLSILTRTIDRPRMLGRMLDSLLAQTYADWECVIINGGSDASVDSVLQPRAAAIDGRVRVLAFDNPTPGMRGAPLNHGLTNSDSELITILDDDDTWHPDFLRTMIEALDRAPTPSVAGIVCQTRVIEETSVEEGLQPQRDYVLNEDLHNVTLARLAIVNAFCIHAFIYRRTALERTGGYANDLPVLEDWDFNLRFLTHHDVMVVPQVLTNYHLRKSVTSGAEANSQTGEVDLHKFFESKIINDALRRDFARGQAGLGSLLSNATNTRFLERKIHALESKLKSAADKIGKIDARTKELKDRR